ncbi:hypothetical protein LCGC14_2958090, partial [marine sediment metagenome]
LKQTIKEDVPIVIIGNKVDLVAEVGEVTDRAEAEQFAETENALLIETSAKSGDNVEVAFVELTRKIIKKYS